MWASGPPTHHSQWQWDDSVGLQPPLSVAVWASGPHSQWEWNGSGFWYQAGMLPNGLHEGIHALAAAAAPVRAPCAVLCAVDLVLGLR